MGRGGGQSGGPHWRCASLEEAYPRGTVVHTVDLLILRGGLIPASHAARTTSTKTFRPSTARCKLEEVHESWFTDLCTRKAHSKKDFRWLELTFDINSLENRLKWILDCQSVVDSVPCPTGFFFTVKNVLRPDVLGCTKYLFLFVCSLLPRLGAFIKKECKNFMVRVYTPINSYWWSQVRMSKDVEKKKVNF